MQVSVTFRNTEAEEWFKDYVNERLAKLKKYIDKPLEAHVIMTVEKFRHVAEINLKAKGVNIVGKEEAKDMQLAFDAVMDKVERQVKKHREILRHHKSATVRKPELASTTSLQDEAVAEGEEERGRVIEIRKIVVEPMSLDDAILALEGSKNPFFIYRDLSSENVSVLYRRNDGNYALIEASH
jgi:putative sigma-54 modulation protein